MEMMIKEFNKMLEIRMSAGIGRFLGLSVEDSGSSIKIDMDMTKIILKFFKIENCRPVATPPPHGIDLSLESVGALTDATLYRQLVDALMLLDNTVRPDNSFSVDCLARYIHRSSDAFWTAGKHRSSG